jgi:putative colanic acid biosynthesis acetyltransferase WcaF
MSLHVNSYGSSSGWSWQIKLKRVLWAPFRIFFLPGTTQYLSPLRVLLLRVFGADIKGKVLIQEGVKIWYPWNLVMRHGASIGRSAEVYNFAAVNIGEQATVSQYAYLCTASHDYTKSTMPLTYLPIVIADQGWVAAGAFIGPGVSVGQGAVVGARAVVTRDVAPWKVVAGNPAREVRSRHLVA